MHIYLFGAGASAAEGAPATRNMFERAWERLGPDHDPQIREVWRFLEETFGVAVSGPASFACLPAVDEVVGLIDWCLHADQGLGHRYDLPALYRVRRAVEHLIAAVLECALLEHKPGPDQPYARFVQALYSGEGPRQFALISLNYDTLLDEALTAAGVAPDYGLRSPHEGRGRGPLLSKLHGSLNWALCPACGEIAVTMGPARCARCDNRRLRRLLISPTWRKSYNGAELQRVWERAFEALQQADQITFFGYSLPPVDVAIYQLILRGRLAGRWQAPPQIVVVEHHSPGSSVTQRARKESAVRERFTRLFGEGVRFDFTGFSGQTLD